MTCRAAFLRYGGGLLSGPPPFGRTPQSASLTAPLAGEPLECGVSGRCGNHTTLPPFLAWRREGGRGRPPEGLEGKKVFSQRTSSAPTLPVRCRHIAAGEDGYHPGRARELVRPTTTTSDFCPTAARRSRGGRHYLGRLSRKCALCAAADFTSRRHGSAVSPTDRPPPKAFFLSGV